MNVQVVRGPDGLNRRAFSAADIRRMTEAGILAEDDPFELVDGELIEMAAKGFSHERVKEGLVRRLVKAVDDEITVSIESTWQLDALTLLEPDVLAFRGSGAYPSEEGYRLIRPDAVLLAIEVSKTSLAYDRRRKAAIYARHGVPEYWVVDLNKSRVLVHAEPTEGGYGALRKVPTEETLAARAPELKGFAVRLADLL